MRWQESPGPGGDDRSRAQPLASVVVGRDGEAVTVQLRGDADQVRLEYLVGAIAGAAKHQGAATLDLHAVKTITAVGLGTIVTAIEELRNLGIRIQLVRVSHELRTLMVDSGVGHLLGDEAEGPS